MNRASITAIAMKLHSDRDPPSRYVLNLVIASRIDAVQTVRNRNRADCLIWLVDFDRSAFDAMHAGRAA